MLCAEGSTCRLARGAGRADIAEALLDGRPDQRFSGTEPTVFSHQSEGCRGPQSLMTDSPHAPPRARHYPAATQSANLQRMIAAITGANGFIGRHVVQTFARAGWETRPIQRADFISGGLESLVHDADVVVHVAGATRAPTERELWTSNVELTSRVIAAAKRGGVKRLVYVSSQAAAGPAASDTPITEETLPAPVEAYGRSKLDAEHRVRASDVPHVIARPSAVYGPYDRDFLPVFRLARRGIAIHAGNRDQKFAIVHVRDLVDAIFRCAQEPSAAGQTFFFCNDAPVTWGDLFHAVADCMSKQLSMDVQIPVPMVALGAAVGDAYARLTGRTGLLTSHKVALSLPQYWLCSNAAARRDLGWTPQIDLASGLGETYRWYAANGRL